ncbi:hypothetical protein Bca52824_029681 [Brassica carinata]|uniref:cyclin-dependent kinase n=1 Tax=Brassica carinata TaxID=52824 RepID=A0A8X7S977_BRACI|nr:hypothetical protein Bca52824_029681 [Brassica carinata]
METTKNNYSRSIDHPSGYDQRTGIYHSLRPSLSLPPIHQPLSTSEYVLSLLLNSSPPATAGKDVESVTYLVDASSGDSLTYGELLRKVRSLAASLKERFTSGDVAFILSPASLNVPVLYLALMSIGVVLSPANPIGSELEVSHQVEVSKPVIAFATSQTVNKLPPGSFPLGVVLMDSPEFLSWLTKPESENSLINPVRVNQTDPAAILFSSGTTGRVKGVLLTHRNIIASTAVSHQRSLIDPVDYDRVGLFSLPLFHVFGFGMMIRAISLGEKLVLLQRFELEAMMKAVEKYKVTGMPVSPPLIVALVKSELTRKYDLSSLRSLGCGGAPLGKDIAERFKKKFPGVDIVQGYGLTESSGPAAATFGPEETVRYGSVGRISENIEAKIVDPSTGEALPPGKNGELWLRGPVIMKGYVENEKATAETLDQEGWLKTGDLCYIDSEGFLYIVDRLKELIKYKAYQVPPVELEQILQSNPDVVDAAVVPFPDEDAGEIPMAFIVRKPGSNLNESQVIDFVAKQVAPYKKVRRVAFINAIPKNPAGKILRRELTKVAEIIGSSRPSSHRGERERLYEVAGDRIGSVDRSPPSHPPFSYPPSGGVDVSRSSLSVKKDHDFYRNGTRGDGERRHHPKRPNEQDLRRSDVRGRSRLASEKWEPRDKEEEEGQRPAEKRRKFSPILWGVEDEVAKAPSREKTRSTFTSSCTNVVRKQDVNVTRTKKTSPKDQVDVVMSPEPVEAQLSEMYPVDELEEGQLEEEQEVKQISPVKKSSRWETGLTSHKEELISHAVDNVPKTSRWNRNSLSPECGELVVSEERQCNSSESGSGHHSLEQLSANGYSDHEYCSSPNDELENEEPASPAQGAMNMLLGSRSVNGFQKLNKINEGTYGIVYRARDEKTKEIVALKKIKMKEDKYEEEYGFPLTSLREINILLSCNHPSIVNVKEVVVGGRNDSDVYMVMEHLEHDLKCLMERKKQPFSTSEVKCLMLQLLEGVHYLHTNWIIHRDLKPSNLLMNNSGELKICDFGMARQYGSPIKPYTQMVITQWYRPPELLLGAKQYSTAVDMWSIGCIMAELLSQKPLFPGKTELDQLQKIFAVLGTPDEAIWPGFSSLPNAKAKFPTQSYNLLRKKFPAISFVGGQILSERGFDLLNGLLTLDPEKRLTVEEALNHSWFHEVPLPKSQDFMPTFPPRR